jgi:DNA-binding SARP family transcriptional activator/class 3 adenylate cyclase/tetratricopeptide (TPR) repeat protein
LQRGDSAVTEGQSRLGPGAVARVRWVRLAPHSSRMDFRILGPLEVLDEGRPIALGGSKPRALLALLLLHPNETLTTDRLIDELWGERAPTAAVKTVQVHISRLRKGLADAARNGGGIVTRERGYELRLDLERLDAHRFKRLVEDGRSELAAGRPEGAASSLEAALSLWRGAPLAEFAYEPFAQREIGRLEDLRIAAVERLIDAKLALGCHREVIGQLEALIAEHPYREGLHAQLMLALYRCDRQADALQTYQNARRRLVEDLGIEPGERLRELERGILAQDPELAVPAQEAVEVPPPPYAGAPRAQRRAEVAAVADAPEVEAERELPSVAPDSTRPARRLVSVVFADLVGSTGLAERLDPEAMHALLDRYTDICAAVIERHGGSVEGFIGDAVVGVFGQTEVHEDDAMRAVRTAVELREAGARLSAELERDRGVRVGMKLGVESGQVFVSPGARRAPFAAGDAFNVAARLESAASDGEIVLGDNVYCLVETAVRAERLEPMAVKGRAAKVQAWRLLALEADEVARLRPPGSRFVGRERELEELRGAFRRVCDQQACHLVTVVGPPGIGKTRLVQEFVAGLGEDATVAAGRCPSYGEGVAYRPLTEIVRQLGEGDPRDAVNRLLEGNTVIAELVLAAIGLSDGAAQAEETFLAVRRLLEEAARERPLVVVVDDVHWAEPTLLDLLDYLVAFSSEHPLLLLGITRPDLLETRGGWGAPHPNTSLLLLDALSDVEARRLVESAGGAALESATAARIVDTAEGNPLFLEQLVAVGADTGEAALPSSIQAVLAARIDRLEPGERAVLEDASVQGRSFYVDAVEELLAYGGRRAVAAQLVSLVRKQLIRADRSELPGEDAFRFAHVLIREAAYDGLPKQRRAELHERLARWLERRPGAREEDIGHHLAEAYRHRAGLGPVGERERALAAVAAERLGAAARSALVRGDLHAGAHLLERAASLLAPDDPARAPLLPELGAALLDAGRLADADRVLAEAIERTDDNPPLQSRARVERELVRLQAETSAPIDDARRVAESALRVLEGHRDELGQCRAWCLWAEHSLVEGRLGPADGAWQRAAEHARRAGNDLALLEVLDWRAAAAVFGPTPVPEAIERCEALREQVQSSPVVLASVLRALAALHAMKGDLDEAHRLVDASDEIIGELGGLHAAVSQQEALVEMLAGQPAAAEERLRAGYERLEAMGEKALLATTAAMLAQVVYAQGREDEAEELCRVTERAAAANDLAAQVTWRGVCAKRLAEQGRADEAEPLAREAVRLAEPTDLLTIRADAWVDLAAVLRHGGQSREADVAIAAALALYEQKGDVVSAERARLQLAAASTSSGRDA